MLFSCARNCTKRECGYLPRWRTSLSCAVEIARILAIGSSPSTRASLKFWIHRKSERESKPAFSRGVAVDNAADSTADLRAEEYPILSHNRRLPESEVIGVDQTESEPTNLLRSHRPNAVRDTSYLRKLDKPPRASENIRFSTKKEDGVKQT